MENPNLAIKVSNVSKHFKLPHEKNSTIKGMFIKNAFRGSMTYEKQKVLHNISFDVKEGEFFGVVGRNGSGKSTLLKLLAGIYNLDEGSIYLSGKLTPFIELGVGFNPELTGRENVYLNGALLGFDRKQVADMYDEIVEFAELEEFMDQKLKNYSSGMQVRLAFSIAIRAETDILLIDEVLAVGDAIFQQKCLNFFKKIKGKRTVVFISHDMRAVEKFCDRVLIIDKGKQIDIGDPHEMVYKYGALLTDEQNTKSSKRSTGTKGTHLGTGNVSIVKSQVMDESGQKSIEVINQKEPFIIRFDYKSHTKIDDPVFLVTIFDSSDTKLISSTTEAENYKTNQIHNKGYVEFYVKDNPLAPGSYKYNLGIFGPNMVVAHDHFRGAGEFRVAGSNWAEARVITETSWSVKNGS